MSSSDISGLLICITPAFVFLLLEGNFGTPASYIKVG